MITAHPTISTTANPSAGGIGTKLQDSATLAGTSSLDGTGTITFKLFAPGDGSCTAAVHTETVTGVKSNGPFSTTTGYVASVAGTYEWTASFSGDSNNAGVASTCGAEPVVVTAHPTISTTANPSAGGIGTKLQDSATLAGTSSLDGTGTITFKLFAPGDGSCTAAVHTETVTGVKSNGPFSTTTGYVASVAGTYEWTASFSGDSNNAGVASTCGAEPVVVTAHPTISTTANPSAGGIGTKLQDSATLAGTSSLDGTGTITFKLFAPGDSSCAAAVHTETVTGVKSNGPFSTTTGYVASVAGTYEWTASFSGDSNNAGVASTCGAEPVVITAHPTISTTANPMSSIIGMTLQDSATLAGTSSLDGTGTITFKLFAPGDSSCTAAVHTETVTGVKSNGPFSTTTGYVANAVGTYQWTASFSGDGNNAGVTSACGAEAVSVGKATPTIVTAASPTKGIVGVVIKVLKDSATLAGTPIAPTGPVAFALYSNSGCTTPVSGVTGSGAISGGTASFSVKWTPKAAGTYYWIASYGGDANNAAVASTCGEPVVITAQPTISTTANPKSAGIGTTLQDSATLASTSNLLGTGSITFKLYAPGDGSCASAIHTETVTAVKTNGPFTTTTGITAKTVGTYQWTAAFTGDANNAAASSKCGADAVTVGPQISEITPVATTCAQFASGFATSLPSYQYTLSGSKIGTVTPSSFTYWVKVPSTGTYKITQSTNETSKKLVLSSGSGVYDNATASSCTTVSGGITQSTTSDAVTVKVTSGSGPFYIGLNFSTSKVIGEAAPGPSTTVAYTFSAGLTGASSVIDLKLG